MKSQVGNYRKYSPDILKNNLHEVHIVLVNGDKLKSSDYDTTSDLDSVAFKGSEVKYPGIDGRVQGYSLESKINFSTSIQLIDVINDSFGADRKSVV